MIMKPECATLREERHSSARISRFGASHELIEMRSVSLRHRQRDSDTVDGRLNDGGFRGRGIVVFPVFLQAIQPGATNEIRTRRAHREGYAQECQTVQQPASETVLWSSVDIQLRPPRLRIVYLQPLPSSAVFEVPQQWGLGSARRHSPGDRAGHYLAKGTIDHRPFGLDISFDEATRDRIDYVLANWSGPAAQLRQ
jgi:hypothetical protein